MKRLVLVGAGHAHAQVLRDWIAAPLAGTELCIVSPSTLAPYSGMVPGWLAGHYRYEAICIDFAALAAAAGARFIADELVGLDADRHTLELRDGAALRYDVLSLNVGSTLAPPELPGARVLALRPLGRLRSAWEALLDDPTALASDRPLTLTSIGAGAGGIEALLAVRHRLMQQQPRRAVHGVLADRNTAFLPGLAPGAVRRVRRALSDAGVALHLGTDCTEASVRGSDLVLWATGAQAHAWQRASGLAVSPAGFIEVDARLHSVSHANVLAAGDCAEWVAPLPKAGVYAVRMSPVLSHNLRAALGAGASVEYVPQRRVLSLLATGERHAIASWGRWSAQGAWVWRWKDHIDRRFLRRFDVENPSLQATDRRRASGGDAA